MDLLENFSKVILQLSDVFTNAVNFLMIFHKLCKTFCVYLEN